MSTTQTLSKTEESILKIRQLLPLPGEYQSHKYSRLIDAGLSFIRKLGGLKDTRSVIEYARTLKVSELKMIFPALLADAANDKNIQDRLMLLIRERACRTLYNSGWIIFQHNPFNPVIQKSFALICSILEIKNETAQEMSFAGLLQRGTTGNTKTSPGNPPMISNLAAPGHRSFIKRLVIVLSERGLDLVSFFREYAIDPDSVLAANLSGHSFLVKKHFTLNDIDLFEKVLIQTDDQTRSELIRGILASDLSDHQTFSEYCKIIYRNYGQPANGHSVWATVNEREKAIYERWLLETSLRSHCQNTGAKANFYNRYLKHIKQTEYWNEDTLLIFFDGFVIADNRLDHDSAMYYGSDQPSAHPYGIAADDDESDPANPAIPHRSCEESLKSGSTDGTVILYFNRYEIKNSSAFIDFCLQSNRGALSSLKRRFFD